VPTVFSHAAVAVALQPWFARSGASGVTVLIGALCTVVPDLDVVGLRLGIPYASPLGHRGLSHSLLFAVGLALLLTAVLGRRRSPRAAGATFLFLFLCTASHGVLDAFTNGGLGVAFLAPFDNERHFFPWRPISVSPLSLSRFFSGRGWQVVVDELVWVLVPCVVLWLLGVLRNRGRGNERPPDKPRAA
jgi:inner membrane protein